MQLTGLGVLGRNALGAALACLVFAGCNESSGGDDAATDGGVDGGGLDAGMDGDVSPGPDGSADGGEDAGSDADAGGDGASLDAQADADAGDADAGPPGFDVPGLDARLSNPCAPPSDGQMWSLLSETGCFEEDGEGTLVPIAALIPFDINSALWSDYAGKQRLLSLPDGETLEVLEDGDLVFPEGTMFIKTFSLEGRRLETRFLVHHPARDDGDGGVVGARWEGYAYRWRDDDSDAYLLTEDNWDDPAMGAVIENVPGPNGLQRWTIPWTPKSHTNPDQPGQPVNDMCMRCHTPAARFAIGPELRQLNKLYEYPSTGRTANQVYTWEELGLFAEPLPEREEWPYLQPYQDLENPERTIHPDVLSGEISWEVAARSYLHSNCSYCHRPTGPGPSEVLLVTTDFADTGLCDADAQRNAFNPELPGKLFVPGDADQSVLFARMTDETPYGELRPGVDGGAPTPRYRMPYMASDLVDPVGTSIVRNWIEETASCP